MYRVFFLLMFLLLTINIKAQRSAAKLFGTVKIDTNVFMPQTEVTISDWIYFIINNDFDPFTFPNQECLSTSVKKVFNDLKKGEAFQYFKLIKSSGVRRKISGDIGFNILKSMENLEDTDTNYFSINNPISGITYKQAFRYCQWLESVVNTYNNIKVRVSLPTANIFTKIINNVDSFCVGKCDSCHRYLLNCRMPKCNTKTEDKRITTQGQGIIRADGYRPNNFGMYCTQGNVAEITDVEGVAMGGSFNHYARQSYNDQKQEYTKPEPWLGFRYVVTLK